MGPKLSKDQSALLKFWVSKCKDGKLPLRRDVSPAELISFLSNISIVERRPSGEDVFRLTGSALREILGSECRGEMVKEICGISSPWSEALNQTIKTRAPVFGHSPAGHNLTHNWMRLPLRALDNGRQPILCYDYLQREREGAAITKEAIFVTARALEKIAA